MTRWRERHFRAFALEQAPSRCRTRRRCPRSSRRSTRRPAPEAGRGRRPARAGRRTPRRPRRIRGAAPSARSARTPEMRVMTRSGLTPSSTSGPRPHFSSVPGRKFSSSTSQCRSRSSTIAAAALGLQVEHDGLLVAVDRAVQHRRVAGVEPPVAQLVAGDGPLDLDHLGAEVGEHPARGRGGDVVAEFEHPDAREGPNGVVVHGFPQFRVRAARSSAG